MKRLLSRLLLIVILAAICVSLYVWLDVNEVLAPSSCFINCKTIAAAVVPHHDLVKDRREAFLLDLSKRIKPPKTIILVSPNHFFTGTAHIQTASRDWTTIYGPLKSDPQVIRALTEADIPDAPDTIRGEHGIMNLIGEIVSFFPEATFVPIAIEPGTSEAELQKLHAILDTTCHDCLILASVDFSHYQPAILAELHDNLARRALTLLDIDTLLSRVEVDSPESLALIALWAKSHNTSRFVETDHTNSGVIFNDLDGETTTHFFGYYEEGQPATPPSEVSFVMGGDMMFARGIARTYLYNGGLTKAVESLGDRVFWGVDAGIINLEGAISDTPITNFLSPTTFVFIFDPSVTAALNYLHINTVSLGNNHSDNNGFNGIETSQTVLRDAGIDSFGDGYNNDVTRVSVIEGHNLKLILISVNTLRTFPSLTPLIQQYEADPSNRILIMPHWGTEYVQTHSPAQEAWAHEWIDAGADLIIGAHPHVIQDTEVYNGKPIIYSLGNLLFDQTWSKETQEGMLVAGRFNEDSLELFGLPVVSRALAPRLATGELKQSLLKPWAEGMKNYMHRTETGDVYFFPNK